DFCSQDLNSGVKPGFPKTVKTNNPEVLKAARHSVEKFNNCTNDIFLFKESHISRALVQVVKGLKYMLEVEISRTICRKNTHACLDHCDFQSNPTLKQTLSCYSEVWVIPWLHSFEVPVLRCH
uniref:Cystatin F (leukocystatin) n=2 Tax=Jaculus jaculus TaxID=51337 RepID=A0A8C5KQB4_JACJA